MAPGPRWLFLLHGVCLMEPCPCARQPKARGRACPARTFGCSWPTGAVAVPSGPRRLAGPGRGVWDFIPGLELLVLRRPQKPSTQAPCVGFMLTCRCRASWGDRAAGRGPAARLLPRPAGLPPPALEPLCVIPGGAAEAGQRGLCAGGGPCPEAASAGDRARACSSGPSCSSAGTGRLRDGTGGRDPSVRPGVLGAETEQPSAASCRAWALGQSPGPSALCRARGPVYLPFPSSEIKHLPPALGQRPGQVTDFGDLAWFLWMLGGGRSPGRRPGCGPAWLCCGRIWAQQHLGSGPAQHLGRCPVSRGQTA